MFAHREKKKRLHTSEEVHQFQLRAQIRKERSNNSNNNNHDSDDENDDDGKKRTETE